jgi:hypothetical protein
MIGWRSLYTEPTVLTTDWAHERIYAAFSYEHIRDLCVVPIVASEALALAQHVPICWQMIDGTAVLSALISLRQGDILHSAMSHHQLPLCLQSYPLVVPSPEEISRQKVVIDRIIADKPTDLGAPIVMPNGRVSPGALARAKTAMQLAQAIPATQQLSDDLLAADMLEPWPLKFGFAPDLVAERSDLMVAAGSRLGSPALFEVVSRHGVEAGLFLGLHRLSLFRINALVHLAKHRARRQATAQHQTATFQGLR